MAYSGSGTTSITVNGAVSPDGNEHTVTVESDGDDAKTFSEGHRAVTQAQVELAEAQAAARGATVAEVPTAQAPTAEAPAETTPADEPASEPALEQAADTAAETTEPSAPAAEPLPSRSRASRPRRSRLPQPRTRRTQRSRSHGDRSALCGGLLRRRSSTVLGEQREDQERDLG